MTKEQFDSLYYGKAVHCDTEEKANHFLALADSVGYRWSTKRKLIHNQWEIYKEETCYELTRYGFMFANTNYFNKGVYEIIKYEPQSKFKVGDKVRIKDVLHMNINGKDGVIEKVNPLSTLPYYVKVDRHGWTFHFCENELEKVEESTYKEETIDDIIKEIRSKWREINILLNRLEKKRGVKDDNL